MNDIESKLSQCFLNVFPDLAAADLPRASQASLTQWDSVAHITLLLSIAEEFQIELDEEVFPAMTSYLLIRDYVESNVGKT